MAAKKKKNESRTPTGDDKRQETREGKINNM